MVTSKTAELTFVNQNDRAFNRCYKKKILGEIMLTYNISKKIFKNSICLLLHQV